MARLDVLDRQARVGQARAALVPFVTDAANTDALVGEGEGEVARAADAVAAAKGLMRSAAVNSFMYATGGAAATSTGFGEYDQRRGEELSESVLDHRQEVVDAAQARLAEAESRLVALRRVAEATDQRVEAFNVLVSAVEDDLEAAELVLVDAERGSAPRMFDRAAQDQGWQLEIMGPSTFTADEVAAWYAEKGQGGQTTEPVLDVVRYYVEEGQAEGVRGDVALAQAVLETGWFRNDDTRRFNNYAGIGHCDSCPTGFQFPSARVGVRAQVQHLKTYVMRDPVFASPLVDRRLYGPAACCQTWNELTGVWATNPVYGPTLLAIYEQMLDWLVARRTVVGSG
jgi:hypothetical protein